MRKYIRYIKLWFASTGIKCLRIFPIREKKITFMSFRGQISDSPKYLYEYLRKKEQPYLYCWIAKETNGSLPKGCIISRPKGINLLYNLVTSKVIITNDFLNTYYPKRKGQTIVNTWHGGSPLKTVGMVGGVITEEERDFYRRHDKIYSCFLSSSKFMTEEVFRRSFGFTGAIHETGMPRNAILLRNHLTQEKKVREYYKIEEEKKIVLYAPTFRGNAKSGEFLPKEQQFNIIECLKELEKRFQNSYSFLFRAHHACHVDIDLPGVYNASDYPDMQELLCASDVLITDYSSCMGDEALMYKPVFLYCPDLEEYIKERGFYWDIYSLPFPVSTNQKELLWSISNFDKDKYKVDIDNYLTKLGTFENEKADEIVGEMIIRIMDGNIKNEKQICRTV